MSAIVNNIRQYFVGPSETSSKPWISDATARKIQALFLACLIVPVGEPPKMQENGETSQAIGTFPLWYEKFMHPGLLSNSDGSRYCVIRGDLPEFGDCDSYSKYIEETTAKEAPERYQELKTGAKNSAEKGAFVEVNNDMGTKVFKIHFGTNPQKLKNHRVVLRYLEKNVLQNPRFFDLNPNQIIEEIKKTHRMITLGLPNPEKQLTPGKFRKAFSFVTEDKESESLEIYRKIMKKNGAKPKDIRTFERSLEKAQQYESMVMAYKHFTAEEKKVWGFLGHVPPQPDEIEGKMLELAKELKVIGPKVIHGSADPVNSSGWFHQKFGNIHPFGDGNGRVVRPWMNALMQLGGRKAIIFPSDEEYTNAVRDDQRGKRNFSAFLRDVIAWNERQESLK